MRLFPSQLEEEEEEEEEPARLEHPRASTSQSHVSSRRLFQRVSPSVASLALSLSC